MVGLTGLSQAVPYQPRNKGRQRISASIALRLHTVMCLQLHNGMQGSQRGMAGQATEAQRRAARNTAGMVEPARPSRR